MGSTLQDQFLKMGLVNKKQVDSAKKERHERRTGQDEKGGEPEKSKILAQQVLAEKRARSRKLNQAKNKELKEQETAARIRQLIDTNRLPLIEGETPYNFTDDKKIKRILLTKNIIEGLSKGDLAIVKQAGEYQLVPAGIADTVRTFNKKLVIVYHPSEKSASPRPEDPYAEFQVPDDLMW